jgi:hypothetical protein
MSRIIKMDLAEGELSNVRSMFADRTITDVYVRTDEYVGEPRALVDVVNPRRLDPARLDAALQRIGHQSSPTFRRRLAAAYGRTSVRVTR